MDVSQPVLVATASAHLQRRWPPSPQAKSTISALYAATVPTQEAFGE